MPSASEPPGDQNPKRRDDRRITSGQLDQPKSSSQRKRLWRITRFILSLGLAGYGLYVVYGKGDELSGAAASLNHLRLQWLACAIVVEATSMVAFAALERRLLMAGRLRLPLHTTTGIALASYSIQNSLPAGPVFSNVYAFRQFRSRGSDDVLAGWVLVGTAALTMMTLVFLAGIGLAGAYGTGSGLDLVGDIVSLVAGSALVVLVWSRRDWIGYRAVAPLRLVKRLFKWPKGDPNELVAEFVARMHSITPSKADWVMAISFALANWVFDVSCLISAFLALGAPVPWRALLLAYAAAQLAANLPITPGGLGVVEGSLTIALLYFGGSQSSTSAAVLLYRLLSFWALLPIGWVAWATTNWDLRRRETRRAAAAAAAEIASDVAASNEVAADTVVESATEGAI